MSTHHIGITVADLDRSVESWELMLGYGPVTRGLVNGPHIGELLGYFGVILDRALFELPGGPYLELLRYVDHDESPYDPATAHPGNVHICLEVDSIDDQWARGVAAGAVPVAERTVTVPAGAAAGTRLGMLRTPDGVSIELLEPAR